MKYQYPMADITSKRHQPQLSARCACEEADFAETWHSSESALNGVDVTLYSALQRQTRAYGTPCGVPVTQPRAVSSQALLRALKPLTISETRQVAIA